MKKRKIFKIILSYILITLFCILFSLVYEHFSHGVYSDYMLYMFLFPLIGGVLIFSMIGLVRFLPIPKRLVINLYNSGIATLTIGSCLNGVLEIYGTNSDLISIYWLLGGFLTLSASLIYLFSLVQKTKAI